MIPYGELMKYRNQLPQIYSLPIFRDEYAMILSEISPGMKIVDFGCGSGKIYNDVLLPSGFVGEYIGIDNDPSLNVNFPLYSSIDEFIDGRRLREFDVLIMLNALEHLKVDEAYEVISKLNPYIDSTLIVMTPNPACFDYMFVDPQHVTFYSYEFLFGLFKHFGFETINMWRGKGIHQIREAEIERGGPNAGQYKQMNEFQMKVCTSMGLDWFGNLMIIGERANG